MGRCANSETFGKSNFPDPPQIRRFGRLAAARAGKHGSRGAGDCDGGWDSGAGLHDAGLFRTKREPCQGGRAEGTDQSQRPVDRLRPVQRTPTRGSWGNPSEQIRCARQNRNTRSDNNCTSRSATFVSLSRGSVPQCSKAFPDSRAGSKLSSVRTLSGKRSLPRFPKLSPARYPP